MALRQQMVDEQIVARGIHDASVLAAMRTVPRHLFVDAAHADQAYTDKPIPIGLGQTISQPYIVASMSERLSLNPTDRVLEIGTGSGYQTAILAELVFAVFSIEILPTLLLEAQHRLTRLGYQNVETQLSDGAVGWPKQAPFDAIMVTAAPREVPPALLSQLADGGRLIAPVGHPAQQNQRLVFMRREGDTFTRTELYAVRFVPLRGGADKPDLNA